MLQTLINILFDSKTNIWGLLLLASASNQLTWQRWKISERSLPLPDGSERKTKYDEHYESQLPVKAITPQEVGKGVRYDWESYLENYFTTRLKTKSSNHSNQHCLFSLMIWQEQRLFWLKLDFNSYSSTVPQDY